MGNQITYKTNSQVGVGLMSMDLDVDSTNLHLTNRWLVM